VEKNGETFFVDLDGKLLPPSEVRWLSHKAIKAINRPRYLYIGKRESDGLYKIGITFDGDYSASKVETAVHKFLKELDSEMCVEGEWFRLSNIELAILKMFSNPNHLLEYIERWDEVSKSTRHLSGVELAAYAISKINVDKIAFVIAAHQLELWREGLSKCGDEKEIKFAEGVICTVIAYRELLYPSAKMKND